MAELSVKIGANIKEFQSKLANALKGFDALKKEEKSLTAAFKAGKISSDKYYDALAKNSTKLKTASASINKYKSGIASVGQGMGKMSKGVASGNSAMTAFSRTIQDAPFGIMGVSNNITNLTEQFGYLKKKTGSAGGALKAMLRDLKGFGGISLAISVATSLLLVFGDKIFKTKNKAKLLREEQEKLTQALEDYVNGLESVNRASLKGEKSAQKEIVTLRLLKSQIDDTTLSDKERLGAVNQIRKIYPDYLKNISDEKMLNGGLATTYDKLTTSILKRAKATAATNMIIKNSEKLLILESQIAAEQLKADNKQIELTKQKTKAHQASTNVIVGGAGSYNQKLIEQAKLEGELKDIIKAKNDLIGEQTNLQLTNIDLELNVKDNGGIASAIIPDGTADKVKGDLKRVFVGLKNGYKEGKTELQELIETNPLALASDTEWASIDWDAYYNLKHFEEKKILLDEALNKLNEDVSNMLDGSKLEGLSNFGGAIGNAIGSGQNVLQAAGSSLLGTLGGIMVKYGKLILAFGLASEALKKAMENPFGGGIAAVVAGVALIAIGSAIKGAASSNSSSSSGSGGSSNRGGVSSGTSTFSPSSTSSGGGSSSSALQNVVFEIQGTKLVGVLSNTLARNRSLGGSLGIT